MGKLELNKKRKKSALYNTAFELFTTKGEAGQHGGCQSEADKISAGQPADRVQAY